MFAAVLPGQSGTTGAAAASRRSGKDYRRRRRPWLQYGVAGAVVHGGRECAGGSGWVPGEMRRCLWRRPDALFELADAVLTAGPVVSLPYLSLEPVFAAATAWLPGAGRGRDR